tara:strand:- start:37 stop:753 length:717 start_codon:yes stop_codon:yes gene_type:complete
MAISNATRLSDFGSGIGTAGAVLKVDNTTQRVGIGTTDPRGMLQVGTSITMSGTTGILTATQFIGDGSLLTGISAGSFASNDTGINTTSSVGIGTTNATGAADVKNTAILNVGVVTAVTTFSNIVGTAATFTSILATGLSGTPDVTVNNVTAGFGTFSGNISAVDATLSGTLTYDDVTNVDAVGYATFRSGINVQGAGSTTTTMNVTGVCTAASYVGSGAELTGLPAGFTELDGALFN